MPRSAARLASAAAALAVAGGVFAERPNAVAQWWSPGEGRTLPATASLFAPVDGANCPHLPQGERASHSLPLDRGLLRVFLPWPPRARDVEKQDLVNFPATL